MKKTIFVVFMAMFLLACGQPKQTESSQTVKPQASVSPNQTAATTTNTEIKRGDGTGIVTKINLEAGSIELDHEEIKSMMPKMLMEFYVKDKKMLDGLKVGDKVDFTLEENRGQEMIIKLAKK